MRKVTITCINCGRSFDVIPQRKDQAKYCVRACRYEWEAIHKPGISRKYHLIYALKKKADEGPRPQPSPFPKEKNLPMPTGRFPMFL